MSHPTAVLLLSGGMDSATTGAIAKDQGFELVAVSFRYGQRHDVELDAARKVARLLEVSRHLILDIDLRAIGGSALTDNLAVPKDTPLNAIGERIPTTYVPARNTIFLSFSLGVAEVVGSSDIFIGANALDYSGYPDCRPEYFQAFQSMANLATRAGVEEGRRVTIHTPLIQLTKREIIQRGLSLGLDYGITVSCYDPSPDGAACGRCDACQLRLKGFRELGLQDPADYQLLSGSRKP
ncbi:MAG TPA: 7-cyano-7-deazaguanine synthase QueC [Gemmatimonadales bacterium]|nr:7-cyano-7-deazaguanine synthase QueC [Gemmatimonadales bacterium]